MIHVPKKMIAFAVLLAPPVLWAAHFGLAYWAVSLELTLRPFAGLPSRLFTATLAVAVLALLGWIVLAAPRLSPSDPKSDLFPFWLAAVRYGALIAAAGIVWQTLPMLLVP